MVTRATKKTKNSRARDPVAQTVGRIRDGLREADNRLRALLRMLETPATRVEMMARGRVARALRDEMRASAPVLRAGE